MKIVFSNRIKMLIRKQMRCFYGKNNLDPDGRIIAFCELHTSRTDHLLARSVRLIFIREHSAIPSVSRGPLARPRLLLMYIGIYLFVVTTSSFLAGATRLKPSRFFRPVLIFSVFFYGAMLLLPLQPGL